MLVNQIKFEPVYCPTAVRSYCNRKNLRNEKMIHKHISISLFTMRIMFHCISKRRGTRGIWFSTVHIYQTRLPQYFAKLFAIAIAIVPTNK